MVSPVEFAPESPTLDPDEACLVITRVMGLKLMSADLHRALEEVFMSRDTRQRWIKDDLFDLNPHRGCHRILCMCQTRLA